MKNKKQLIKPAFVFDSTSEMPFSSNIHTDCGHTIILVPARIGKSFFGNSLLTKHISRKVPDRE